MEKKSLFALLGILAALLGTVALFSFGDIGTAITWRLSNGGSWLLPLVGISALIDSVNPCAFSILLLTIAFLFSIGKHRAGVLAIGGSYIAGMFLVYLLIGLGLLEALHLFDTPHFMGKVGAALLITFGLINLINEFFPAFPVKLRIPHAAHRTIAELMEKGSLPTAFLLGGLVGLCEFPCTGGPYLMVVGLLHDSASYLRGVAYLLFYNLVFVLPLVVILAIASHETLLEKVREWQKSERPAMRIGGGIAMVILGILIFFL